MWTQVVHGCRQHLLTNLPSSVPRDQQKMGGGGGVPSGTWTQVVHAWQLSSCQNALNVLSQKCWNP